MKDTASLSFQSIWNDKSLSVLNILEEDIFWLQMHRLLWNLFSFFSARCKEILSSWTSVVGRFKVPGVYLYLF